MIILKSKKDIKKMRRASQIVRDVLEVLKREAVEGISTWDLDKIAEQYTIKQGAKPAFKGYQNFPGSVCFSINNEIVHGIPRKDKILKAGDIVGMDFGSYVDGFYGDSAVTVPIGDVSDTAKKLLKVTRDSLYRGIDMIRPGKRLFDLSEAIQNYVESAGFSVVTSFVGHGIGAKLHEDPQVPNFVPKGNRISRGVKLEAGMVLAIEPMVNVGGPDLKILEDGWTAVTKDGSLSAHFEHTVAIDYDGPIVLTDSSD